MVIMVLVGWEDEDKAWRINGKVMTLRLNAAGDRPLINSKISYASTQTFY